MINTNKLRSLRAYKGYTQQQMSEMLDMHPASYSQKERGIINFSIQEFLKLMEILECKQEDIFMPSDTRDAIDE